MNHKRIILCGPSASGKNYIREKFREKGFLCDVSYTSREPRQGEINGIDYYFIDNSAFEDLIKRNAFYEWVKYGDYYYGTGNYEWNNCEIFIMETDGISKIKQKDRNDCLIICVDTPLPLRMIRMKERGWDDNKIQKRRNIDYKKFKDFSNYDFKISSE
jgi:guanylate kinase